MDQVVFDHVAVGVHSVAEASRFVMDELGATAFEGGPGIGFQGGQYRFGNGGLLEVLEPWDNGSDFMARFLARHGPGIHHVTFKVPEIGAAAARAERHGYEIVGFDDRHPGWKEAFLHPKQAQGVVVQLAESHPELDPGWGAGWSFPPACPDPPPPASLLRVRLSARDGDAARRQWCDVLAADCREVDGLLRFSWSGSPMQLDVAIDAAGPEGPRWLELAAERPLALPEGHHPELGARFLRVAD